MLRSFPAFRASLVQASDLDHSAAWTRAMRYRAKRAHARKLQVKRLTVRLLISTALAIGSVASCAKLNANESTVQQRFDLIATACEGKKCQTHTLDRGLHFEACWTRVENASKLIPSVSFGCRV